MTTNIIAPAELTMTSREIAELTGKNHADVMRDIRVMSENLTKANLLSCIKSTTYAGKDGRDYAQYELDKDSTLCLVSGYDVVVRMRIIKRWQDLEAQQQPQFKLPQTYSEALRELADSWDREQKLLEENEVMRPKAEYFDALVDRNLLTNFRDTAKELGLKQTDFINKLLERGFVFRDAASNLKPYAQYTPELFELKEWKNDSKSGVQTLITPRGRETFRLLFCK